MSSAKSFLISSRNCAVKVFKICLRFGRLALPTESTNANLTQNEETREMPDGHKLIR